MATIKGLVPASELAAKNTAHFPNESAEYRKARNELLAAEIELRRHICRVGEMRRALPPGGEVTKDYRFVGENGEAGLEELFGNHDTLVVCSMMYGLRRKQGCAMCTAQLSSWDPEVPHLEQRIALAVVTRSPYQRIAGYGRGWRNPKLYSESRRRLHRGFRRRSRCPHARLHNLQARRRHDPAFLQRRGQLRDGGPRPGPPQRARHEPALDHPRHHAGRTRDGLASKA